MTETRDSTPPIPTELPPPSRTRVEVAAAGHVVAVADVGQSAEVGGRAEVILHSAHGRAPDGARAELVDQVMERPELRDSQTLHAVAPLGDHEAISRLQDHTANFTAHAAGASTVIDADLRSPDGQD